MQPQARPPLPPPQSVPESARPPAAGPAQTAPFAGDEVPPGIPITDAGGLPLTRPGEAIDPAAFSRRVSLERDGGEESAMDQPLRQARKVVRWNPLVSLAVGASLGVLLGLLTASWLKR